MTGLVKDKVAIVTGGAKGLGYGISRCLAQAGAHLLITGRDGAAAETVAADITQSFGVRAVGMSADMGVKTEVEAMIERAVGEFGGLDILVNNASQLSPNVLLEQKTDEMLQRTLEIGTWGSWWAMRAAFPHMKARGGGSIINFYSIDAQTGAWLHADYNMNKGAILGLTRTAAVEWGRFNIRTNAIAPTGMGQVFADLAQNVPGFLEMATASNPLKRAGDPEKDIGPVVLFLASEMSRFVNGELINVDGGQHLPGYVSVPHNLAEMEAQT
ncbi:MAG: SDR family oxidoreductase [Sphingobium sp.]|uniref:NAD(P)-dependent oxidoreductase n=1 Tax=Sphingobium xenophagum TaxID=121428 RepID=A0A249MXC3_SPHXE|nr:MULTISPECIES: SDR family oxidoreductase [Sphingobium]MBU0660485.1 SDR family oxidoreductase [Alphaproteobacteria bacterium]ODT93333.1 MAG: short-chain dehydrogenase [Sphingobium sp. SCN 64-10]ASY45976.1 NAD(P)-dependent oxidoreductase [Sphingobium xenophagum]MBA4755493.1 SDR family oxidoreductase [Sphingobium sp.]MBU0775530.1 SDR family oxidoreductase [Alphaproteobacteria bacterium]